MGRLLLLEHNSISPVFQDYPFLLEHRGTQFYFTSPFLLQHTSFTCFPGLSSILKSITSFFFLALQQLPQKLIEMIPFLCIDHSSKFNP
mmetsp:Transcript_29303/g.62291  ORF Transcript_29303/g.62291 Transcript_29303/m.62291 type:complete len:89 (-) Transcript_29303:2825-3091(-)